MDVAAAAAVQSCEEVAEKRCRPHTHSCGGSEDVSNCFVSSTTASPSISEDMVAES